MLYIEPPVGPIHYPFILRADLFDIARMRAQLKLAK